MSRAALRAAVSRAQAGRGKQGHRLKNQQGTASTFDLQAFESEFANDFRDAEEAAAKWPPEDMPSSSDDEIEPKSLANFGAALELTRALGPSGFPGSGSPNSFIHGAPRSGSNGSMDSEASADRPLNPWIIKPYSKWKFRWDVLIAVLILYTMLDVPFRLGFNVDTSLGTQILDNLVDAFFVIDMILTFFTGFFDDRERYVDNFLRIAVRYVTTFFVVDFLSVFPFNLILDAVSADSSSTGVGIVRTLRLFRLAKLARIFRLRRLIAWMDQKANLSPQVLDLVKTLGKVVCVVHLITCLIYWVAQPVCPDGSSEPCNFPDSPPAVQHLDNWVVPARIDLFSLPARYITTFYFMITTTLGIGYGDLVPVNTEERLVIILCQLIGAFALGVILSAVTAVMDVVNAREFEYRQSMDDIKDWAAWRNLPPHLVKRVWSEANSFQRHKLNVKDSREILGPLPNKLRYKVVSEIYEDGMHLLRDVFQSSGNQAMMTELVLYLCPMHIGYKEHLLDVLEPVEEVFIMKTGRVEAFVDNTCTAVLDAVLKVPAFADDAEQSECTLQDYSAAVRMRTSVTSNHQEAEAAEGQPACASRSSTPSKEFLAEPASPMSQEGARLCAIHLESEVICPFTFSPATFRGAEGRSEVLTTHKSNFQALLLSYPEVSQEWLKMTLSWRKEFVKAANSPDYDGRLGPDRRKVKSLVLYKYQATEASSLAGSQDEMKIFSNASAGALAPSPLATRCGTGGSLGDLRYELESDLLRRWIIPPGFAWKIAWDLFVGLLVLYSAILVSFVVGFEIELDEGFVAIDYVIDVLFGIDMLLAFRTAFEDADGSLNTIPLAIAKNYLGSWFLIDFLSTMPIDRIVAATSSSSSDGTGARAVKLVRFIRFSRLLKLIRLLKLERLKKALENSVFTSPLAIQLSSLLAKVLFLGHLLACLWHIVGSMSVDVWDESCAAAVLYCNQPPWTDENSWGWLNSLPRSYPLSEPLGDKSARYVASLYWVFTTITAVGFGDIIANNSVERLCNICIEIFGATVFGYIIGSISGLVAASGIDVTQISLRQMKSYCEEQGLTKRVTKLVCEHYKNWYQENSPFPFEPDLLASLSPATRVEVTLRLHRKVLQIVSVFRFPQPLYLKAAIVRMLDPLAVGPKEYVMKDKEIHGDFFFVYTGIFEATRYLQMRGSFAEELMASGQVVHQDEDDVVEIFTPGCSFGFESLLSREDWSALGQVFMPRTGVRNGSDHNIAHLFCLKKKSLLSLHRSERELSLMIQDILAKTIIAECIRRHKAAAKALQLDSTDIETVREVIARRSQEVEEMEARNLRPGLRKAGSGESRFESSESQLPSPKESSKNSCHQVTDSLGVGALAPELVEPWQASSKDSAGMLLPSQVPEVLE